MTSLKTVRAWYWVHKWSSLVCTLFLLFLCLTGLPLIFHHEIDHLTGREVEAPPGSDDSMRAGLDGVVAAAREVRPGETVRFVSVDGDDPLVFVMLGKGAAGGPATAVLAFDARTGQALGPVPIRQGVMYFLLRLHADAFLGLPGELFLGFMGLLFTTALVSGAVLYGPFMRKLPFGAVRRHRAPRVRWLDLHNLLGIVTILWAFAVGVTGVINTLAKPIVSYWQATELAEMTAPWRGKPVPAEIASLQAAVDTAIAAVPGKEVGVIAFPGTPFAGSHHYGVFLRGMTPLTERLVTPVLIDAETGALAATRSLPWYVVLLRMSQPLHFGDYGGLPLKIIWALLDLITIVVLGSGLYLWFTRRRGSLENLLAEAGEETVTAGSASS